MNNRLAHLILFRGRSVFPGYALFAWTADYNVSAREKKIYTRMFEERNLMALLIQLKANKIAYVGIDDRVRGHHLVKKLNEEIYQQNFLKVFEDTEHKYENLTIYQVP